jgi:hypothetical protein
MNTYFDNKLNELTIVLGIFCLEDLSFWEDIKYEWGKDATGDYRLFVNVGGKRTIDCTDMFEDSRQSAINIACKVITSTYAEI